MYKRQRFLCSLLQPGEERCVTTLKTAVWQTSSYVDITMMMIMIMMTNDDDNDCRSRIHEYI